MCVLPWSLEIRGRLLGRLSAQQEREQSDSSLPSLLVQTPDSAFCLFLIFLLFSVYMFLRIGKFDKQGVLFVPWTVQDISFEDTRFFPSVGIESAVGCFAFRAEFTAFFQYIRIL